MVEKDNNERNRDELNTGEFLSYSFHCRLEKNHENSDAIAEEGRQGKTAREASKRVSSFNSSQWYLQAVATAYNYRRYTNKIKGELDI